jgi:hypothetical protein
MCMVDAAVKPKTVIYYVNQTCLEFENGMQFFINGNLDSQEGLFNTLHTLKKIAKSDHVQ